ncbi:hypothetical protein AAF712_007692 [Marasmius tenuissimus]|uniref:REJ domain-containing protein n=1 Tax=Marasmius tenuissimus TaxID=585030 RepID=A0ABR2ZWC6_9AGAR
MAQDLASPLTSVIAPSNQPIAISVEATTPDGAELSVREADGLLEPETSTNTPSESHHNDGAASSSLLAINQHYDFTFSHRLTVSSPELEDFEYPQLYLDEKTLEEPGLERGAG